ncbi:MAG: 4Fe-4S dicluster domain-containing protein [Bacillota bacterium]
MSLTRRKLVTRAAALGAGLALGQFPALALFRAGAAAPTHAEEAAGKHPAVLYDLTQCAGCHFCEIACQVNKGLPPDKSFISFRTAENPKGFPKGAWAVRRHQCMHCLEPACVSACPVAAMDKTEAGPVVYHDERCLGCRYCMNACPFGVPKFDWDSGLLDGALIRKCNFCAERQAEGKLPACINACPTKAVIFGEREEMLAEARRRVAARPDRYVDHIYGEKEAGGTSFLLIAGVPFEELGLPQPGDHPLPEISEKIMSGVLPFAGAWMAVLIGVTGLVRWREQRTRSGGSALPGGKEASEE